jgi:hypothetical protein
MYATLDADKNVVPTDAETWMTQSRDFSWKRVGSTMIDRVHVSTVFLGMNHGTDRNPAWFETMAFDNDGSEFMCHRYGTWADAEAGHELAVQQLRKVRDDALRAVGRPIPSGA